MGACAWCLPLDEPRCQHGSLHFTVQCIGVVCDFTYLVRWHLCLGVLVYVLWVKREALHGNAALWPCISSLDFVRCGEKMTCGYGDHALWQYRPPCQITALAAASLLLPHARHPLPHPSCVAPLLPAARMF
jgi:hypothetical protein